MTKTLTEQWREGTLEQRYYYVKYFGNGQKPFVEIELKNFLLDLVKVKDKDKIEVLAPVPSYDEYKELVSNSDKLEKRLEVSEKEHYRTLEQLRIATGALRETKEKLLHVELSGLDGDNRQKMYDLMFEDGVIDKALKEMEGVK